jgi:peptide/nickel transport system permease protein
VSVQRLLYLAAAPLRRLLLVVAFLPLWCNSAPLLARVDGRLLAPAPASLGAVDWVWLLGGFLELLFLVRARRGRCVVLLALLVVVAGGAFGGDASAVRRASSPRPGEGVERLVDAPLPWSPGIADPAWIADPSALREWPPSLTHWLGTDAGGYDLAARLLHGLRGSLGLALAAAALSTLIGVTVGSACGSFRGWFDVLVMRGVEVLLCFPHLFLVLIVLTWLPRNGVTVVLLIGATAWTGTARLVRGEFQRLREAEFVLAARALGAGSVRVAWKHVLPNALPPLLAAATFAVAGALSTEFALSWLGLGVQSGAASLGTMLAEGHSAVQNGAAARLIVAPAGALVAIVLACHFVAERLRRATTPESASTEARR